MSENTQIKRLLIAPIAIFIISAVGWIIAWLYFHQLALAVFNMPENSVNGVLLSDWDWRFFISKLVDILFFVITLACVFFEIKGIRLYYRFRKSLENHEVYRDSFFSKNEQKRVRGRLFITMPIYFLFIISLCWFVARIIIIPFIPPGGYVYFSDGRKVYLEDVIPMNSWKYKLPGHVDQVSLVLVLFFLASFSVGFPYGSYLINKASKDENKDGLLDKQYYVSVSNDERAFIRRLSWGAFFCPFAWSLGSQMYVWAIVSLVPIVNVYVWLKSFIYGRQISWEKGNWNGFSQFRKRQKIIFLCNIFLYIIVFIISLYFYMQGLAKMIVV